MNSAKIPRFDERPTSKNPRFLVLSGEERIIPHILDLLRKHPQATVTILDENISATVLELFTETSLPINIIIAPYSKELAALFDRIYHAAQMISQTPSSNHRSILAFCL